MFYTIYKTTNLINGKIYIGKHKTKDPNDDYLGSGKAIKSAISKYGVENFKKEILFVFDNEAEMNEKEAELVTEDFVLEDTNYNLGPGGRGGWGYINANNKNVCLSIQWKNNRDSMIESLKKTGRTGGLKTVEKRREAGLSPWGIPFGDSFRGRTHTKETKKKMSDIAKQRNTHSQTGTMWITNGSESKKIKKDDIIPEGWYKGRKMK